MAKLSFSKRIKCLAERREWLKEEKNIEGINKEVQKYGINLYSVSNKKAGNISYRITNLVESTSEIEIYEVSKVCTNSLDSTMRIYEIEEDGLYIFGNQGIFYKGLEAENIEEVFVPQDFKINVIKMLLDIKVAIILGEENDYIIKFEKGKVIQKIENTKVRYINKAEIVRPKFFLNYLMAPLYGKNLLVTFEDSGRFGLYSINENIVKEELWIDSLEELKELIRGNLVKAYYPEIGYYILISCDKHDNTIRKWYEFDVLKQIDEKYYFAYDIDTDFATIIMKKEDKDCKKSEFSSIGTTPKGEYEYVADIWGMKIFKMKKTNSVIVLVINKDKVIWKQYKNAIDINILQADELKLDKLVYIEPVMPRFTESLDN